MNESIFNSPLEISLRILYILKNTKKKLSLQRLIYYNYLLVHSSDIKDGPKSLHANMPNRSCEIVINRNLIKKALVLLISRDLIKSNYLSNGVYYSSNQYSSIFLSFFESEYAKKLDSISDWISKKFDNFNENEISLFMNGKIKDWGAEFTEEI